MKEVIRQALLLCTCAALMMRYVAISVAVPPSSSPSASCSSIYSRQQNRQSWLPVANV